jgi:hypothetical protein
VRPLYQYIAPVLFGTLTIAHTASAQQANDVEALQRRMNSLESKVDALIGLMQKQQPAQKDIPADNAGAPSGRAAAPDVPDGYVPGMLLDVYASAVHLLNSRDDLRLEFPAGAPDASIRLAPLQALPYNQFMKNTEARSLANVRDSLIGVAYSSYLTILKPGKYTFLARTQAGEQIGGSVQPQRCLTQLYFSGTPVLSKDNGKSQTSSSQVSLNLSPGLYEMRIFLVCGTDRSQKFLSSLHGDEFEGGSVTLLMAEPGDHAPRPIPVDRLLIKQ